HLLRAQANRRLGHYDDARADFETALKREPGHAWANHALGRLLATCPDTELRDPKQAVVLAERAVELAPKGSKYWNTLGVANYRSGDWRAAVAALDKSVKLGQGGDAIDWLFLAMAHGKLGNHDEARQFFARARQWLDKNEASLQSDKVLAQEFRHFYSEAEE